MRRLPPLLLAALAVGCARGPAAVPEPAQLKKLPPGIHQQITQVPQVGTVRYTIEVPDGYDGKTPVPLVLALHYGYDTPVPSAFTGRGMIEAFGPGLEGLGAIVLAPDAVGGGWTDADNEKVAVWLTRSVMKTYAIDGKRVVITGFSLGGEGTWFIGSRHQDLFTGAIPVAAPVAGGDAEWKIPVYVIHSDDDEVVSYSAAKKHANAHQGKGAKVVFKTVGGLGHYRTGAYAEHLTDAVKWLRAEWDGQAGAGG